MKPKEQFSREQPTREGPSRSGDLSRRVQQINLYLARNGVTPRRDLAIADPGCTGTVIIPAYNEAEQIWDAMASIESGRSGLEIVVIDNNSTDGTASVVREYARQSLAPVSLITCAQQGYGPTRETGMQVVTASYMLKNPTAEEPHLIVMLDADSRLTPEYIANHQQLSAQDYAAIGVTYRFPPAIDLWIEQITGLPDFLYSIARLSNTLTAAGIAVIQTASQGGAIEVGALAAIDPAKFKEYEKNDTDRFFGWEATRMGLRVGFNPAITYHNARRFEYELAAGIETNQSYATDPGEVRRREQAMSPDEIRKKMESTGKDVYLRYHLQRLQSFVRRNIIEPIISGKNSGEPLKRYLEELGYTMDITAESAVADLAEIFIRQDDMLSLIYQ